MSSRLAPEDLLERLQAVPAYAVLAPRLPSTPPIHLVGGAVRDLLIGITPEELDLAVEDDLAAVAEMLGSERPPRAHPRFGTARVTVGGRTIDLARTRRERYPRPGSLPDVEPADLDEDLRRRDFTVNALALALNGAAPGTLAGHPDALDDLAAGRLRVLHAESFRDDPTRLLRLARYASRLGFAVEPETRSLADAARDGGALRTVSRERIAAELRLLAAEPDPAAAFAALRELGLDAAIAPGYGIADPDRLHRALALLGARDRPELVVLGLAAEHAPADWVALGPEDAVVAAVAGAAEHLAPALAAAERPSQIAAVAGGAPPEAVAAAGAVGPPGAAEAAERWLAELRRIELEIGGADLLAAGVPAGPAIGAGLRAALAGRLDGRLRGREAELAEALRVARGHR